MLNNNNNKVPKVKCIICNDGKEYTSVEAGLHKIKTGHNKWELAILFSE